MMKRLLTPLFGVRAKLLAGCERLDAHRYDREGLRTLVKDSSVWKRLWGMDIADIYTCWLMLLSEKLCESCVVAARIRSGLMDAERKPKGHRGLRILAIMLLSGLLLFLTGHEWSVTAILSGFEPFDYSEFISEYYSADGIIAYMFWICSAAVLGGVFVSIIHKYFVGGENKRFFSVHGFLHWVMVLYLFEISSAVFEPFVCWCARGNLSSYPVIRIVFLFFVVLLLIFAFTDCVDDLLPIYLGIPAFYLFTALKLQYLVGVICQALVPVVGSEAAWGDFGYGIYCFALSYFTRLLIDFLSWLGIIPLLQSLIRFIMFRIPYMLVGVPAVYLVLLLLRAAFG